ncbi:MAG: tRNA (adenosine(37)-N6)-threonylcarbamoyltransferase complex dimerization subunit type 1 TsaB [Eubacterium sp.]|nr:tRNA (adenosine(37)-N6)-threonylcarbamoyltransferase complex dimerization subunit type 1 TsaB [Eubacterium sp.]
MKILGIDSSGMTASVALAADDILMAEFTINNKRTHSETLLPMIDKMLDTVGVEPSELTAVAIASGPGSFTGLRIGAATAKGLALALDIPVVAVPTLEGLAYNLAGDKRLIVSVMDARRNEVYAGAYNVKLKDSDIIKTISSEQEESESDFPTNSAAKENRNDSQANTAGDDIKNDSPVNSVSDENMNDSPVNSSVDENMASGVSAIANGAADENAAYTVIETVIQETALPVNELLDKLEELGREVIFVGDGIAVVKNALSERELRVPFSFAPVHSERQRGASIALLGKLYFEAGRGMVSDDFAPEYLRKSQAERVKDEMK